jgi:hypothetical protein
MRDFPYEGASILLVQESFRQVKNVNILLAVSGKRPPE